MLWGFLSSRDKPGRFHPSASFWLLLGILGFALALRLYGINWDSGYGFHPDERSFYLRADCMYDVLSQGPGFRECLRDYPQMQPGWPSLSVFLDPERSPLNPHWFPLGSILIYVLVLFRSAIELFGDIAALDMRFVGRPLSALADMGTVFMVYVLGRRMFGQRVGLLGAALTALAVIHIQHSHFYRPETFSNLALLAAFWAMLRVVELRRWRDSIILGLMVGLAMAPKVSALPLVLPLALTYAYWIWDSAGGRNSGAWRGTLLRASAHAGAGIVVALIVFVIATPYALLDYTAFVDDLVAQAEMARTAGHWPFTTQYIDTPAFLYQMRQTAVWGLGIPLGIVAWASLPLSVWLAYRHPATRRWDLLLLVWVVPFFLFLESFEVKFLRYVFPLMPFMVLMGARVLFWLFDSSKAMSLAQATSPSGGRNGEGAAEAPVSESDEKPPNPVARTWIYPHLPALAVGLMVVVIVTTAGYALAHDRIYSRPHTAVAASQWLRDTVPPGTSIVMDNHWDEFVPGLYRYDVWQFPVYESDTLEKMSVLAGRLAQSEYLVFYSNRTYGSVARLPDRFPFSSNYYRRLFAGDLGYRLDRSFTSYPGLLGVTLKDNPYGRAGVQEPQAIVPPRESALALELGYADENVIGYDHPKALVFRNVTHLSEADLNFLLVGYQDGRPPTPEVGLLLSDEQKAAQRSGGTWSDVFDRKSWTNRFPVLAWLLAIELIYVLSLPLGLYIFRPLPDRGIVLARILGLLAVGYATWLLVSLGWLDFSRNAIFVGLLIVASLSGVALLLRWQEMREFLARRWRLLLLGEGLFLAAFLIFVAIRAANPDLWHPYRGGEKPMELAYLIAVARSTALPPYDPWFAGGYLNYYYWGYFLLALPIKVARMLPAIAFNLAVPLFFALTFTGAYSLVYNLAEGVRRSAKSLRPRADADDSQAGKPDGDVDSTDSPAARIPKRFGASVGPFLRGGVAAGLVAGLFVSVIGNLDGMVQLGQGIWQRFMGVDRVFPSFDFWRSSRMIPPLENFDPSPVAFWVPEKLPDAPDISWHITEFPFFTFLFADLHAHMMVIPFTLLLVALGLSLLVGLSRGGRIWLAVTAATLGLSLGALWVVNSWDYPSYLVLVLALLAVAAYLGRGSWQARLGTFAVLSGGVVVLSLLAFLPFHQAYETFDTGLAASKWRTPVERYLGIHGLFLFAAGTFLVRCLWSPAMRSIANLRALLDNRDGKPVAGSRPLLAAAVVAGGTVAAVYLLVAGYLTAAMLTALLTLTVLALSRTVASAKDEPGKKFAVLPLLLLGHALLISIGVDLVRLNGDIGRMNTLFKYYLEVWALLGLAAAYMLWKLGSQTSLKWPWGWRKGLWLAVLAALLFSSLVYPVMGTRARVADRFHDTHPYLDGSAYMAQAVHWEKDQPLELRWDLEAMEWLQDIVAGSPVVLEAHGPQYRWNARIASYTGLPTVLGWPWHQVQQRTDYDYEVRQRARDVGEIYSATRVARAEELLREYEVEYIVVGELERVYYPASGLKKFDNMAEAGSLDLVYQNPGVKLYRVVR